MSDVTNDDVHDNDVLNLTFGLNAWWLLVDGKETYILP